MGGMMSDNFDSVFSDEEIYNIGKYFVKNAGWYRNDNHDGKHSKLSIKLPYDADLSSVGSRVDAINRLIED